MADNPTVAISVQGVSKTFKLPHEKQSSIKSALINFGNRKQGYEKQRVIDDISFDIKKGEFFGIVGRNGSGKSTLLKLISGIYTPDKGDIAINGKLTPFIELGVGFSPELTGRENVFLNGALLGFNRKEMEGMYDEIVAFAELERFMDQKLKNYSSGMQVRLAFSIAIQAKSDILVLDEVLAVGDEAFQQKCINIFEQYKALKQTLVLVTHDMGAVERFCTRAIMLKDGKVVKIGTPRAVAQAYSDSNRTDYALQKEAEEAEQSHGQNIKITTLDPVTKQHKKRFHQGSSAVVKLNWEYDGVENAGVAIIKRSGEYVFGPNTFKENLKLTDKRSIEYEVELNLGPGEYYIKAGLFGDDAKQVVDFVDEGPSIIIEGRNVPWGGITHLKHSWKA